MNRRQALAVADELSAHAGEPVLAFGSAERLVLTAGARSIATAAVDSRDAALADPDCSGDPRLLARFLDRSASDRVVGFMGFGMHRHRYPSLAPSDFPIGAFWIPRLVEEVRLTDEATNSEAAAVATSAVDSLLKEGKEDFERAVERAVHWVGEGAGRRVTLARRVSLPGSLGPREAFCRGCLANPHNRAFYFKWGRWSFGGCSPELLLDGGREAFSAFRHSATWRGASPPSGELRGKLDEEHRSTADAFGQVLASLGTVKRVGPFPVRNGVLSHLASRFDVRVNPPLPLGELIAAVLPSGAHPPDLGMALISEHEPVGRGPYYGMVGTVDDAGRASFTKIIRAAFASGTTQYSWVGAGITPGSRPEAEFQETCLKFENIFGAGSID